MFFATDNGSSSILLSSRVAGAQPLLGQAVLAIFDVARQLTWRRSGRPKAPQRLPWKSESAARVGSTSCRFLRGGNDRDCSRSLPTNDPLTHEVQEPKCTSQAHMIFRRRIRIGSSYARARPCLSAQSQVKTHQHRSIVSKVSCRKLTSVGA